MNKFLGFFIILCLSLTSLFAGEDKRKAIGKNEKEQVLSLLMQNELLHGALYDYKKSLLKKASKKFKQEASKVKDSGLKDMLTPTLKAADELMSSQDKSADNESYHKLSLALVKIVETFKIGSTYNIYYCPMVKKRWVQNSKKMRKVHNPYAPEMPHCGGQITEY